MNEKPAIVMTEREHLVRAIKDGLRKIDEHDRKIAEQKLKRVEREVEVGTALRALKAQKPKGMKWEQYLEECGIEIHRSRADQLIRIAGGSTTAELERADTAERVAKSRNELPIRIGENADEPEASAAAMKAQHTELDDDPEMPTAEEAEESYQEPLYDQACLFLDSMTDATRQKFFAHVKERYKEVAAPRDVAPPDDGLDIPACLRRTA